MQALAVFSSIVYGGKQDMTIDVAVPGMSHKFTINNDNKLVLQRLEVSFAFTTHFLEITKSFTSSEYLYRVSTPAGNAGKAGE